MADILRDSESTGAAAGAWVRVGREIDPSPNGVYEVLFEADVFPTSVTLVGSVDGGDTVLDLGEEVTDLAANSLRLVGPVSARLALNVNVSGVPTNLTVTVEPAR
jgi:hypothetical protein